MVYVCVCVRCAVCGVRCVCAHVHVRRWNVCMYMLRVCARMCMCIKPAAVDDCVITKLNRSNILVGCGLRRDSPTLGHQLVDGLGAARRWCRVLPCRYHCNCLHERDIFM